MLLIVTNKTDLASDYLVVRLQERSVRFERINTEDYGAEYQLNLFVANDSADFEIHFRDGSAIRSSDIQAAYMRQPIEPTVDSVVDAEKEFATREVLETLRSAWRLIDESKWLNSPRRLLTATNKVEQLRVATELGFTIPPTCVSADPSIIRDFAAKQGRIVVKAVKHGFVRGPEAAKLAPTQLVTAELLNGLEEYAPVPSIWQRWIDKRIDIRVTVVGDRVFATAIHSQEHTKTSVDWRLWNQNEMDLRHEKMQLSADLEEACGAITRRFGLRYSAIDLVEDPSGEIWFLEMNPNGQWAWIEAKTGYPVRDALIETLGL